MRRTVLLWVATIVGAATILISILGPSLFGLHLPIGAQGTLFLSGCAILLGALHLLGIIDIRMHLTQHSMADGGFVRAAILVLAALLVLAAYTWFISVGQWTRWPPSTDYYDRLAGGFLSGHLYVNTPPDPALLALPNPYDFEARSGIAGFGDGQSDIWDMSLYNGKVYLYWGPAPALLISAIKLIAQVEVGDQIVTFAFLIGLFLFESLLLIRLWRRYFGAVPVWTLATGLLLAGFMNPAPWLLFSPRIYESAIAAGQCFLVGGLYFGFSGLDRDKPSRWRLALTAILWVCAVGSRATLAIPVAFLALMMMLWLVPRDAIQRWSLVRLGPAAAFGLPLLAGAVLLGWYNLARFGSPLEFGFRYAITMLDQNKNRSVLFSTVYLPPNAYLYLLNSPSVASAFPFVKPIWNEELVKTSNQQHHSIYNAEPIVGLLYAAPFLILALIPPGIYIVSAARRRLELAVPPAADPAETPLLRWFAVTLSGAALIEVLVVFLVFYATMRYLMDAAPTLLILSMVGLWLGYSQLQTKRVGLVLFTAIAILLASATIVMGILIGFSSDAARIRAANPALLSHLRIFFNTLLRHLAR